jgi:arginyl-tRNA synthetase
VALEHVSFGSVLGEDGRPLKTREGTPVELASLLDEAVEQVSRVFDQNLLEDAARGDETPTLSPEERMHVEAAVGLGAVKYADLSQNRTSDYLFSFAKMLAMNGNTATYMQYAYVRNRGIFRNAGEDVDRFRADPPAVLLATPFERALAIQILRLPERLAIAAAEYQPSTITSYLWDLAKTYSGFFQNCPVLKAETPELRDSRLLLCDLTARVLELCLQLLGIKTVERM